MGNCPRCFNLWETKLTTYELVAAFAGAQRRSQLDACLSKSSPFTVPNLTHQLASQMPHCSPNKRCKNPKTINKISL